MDQVATVAILGAVKKELSLGKTSNKENYLSTGWKKSVWATANVSIVDFGAGREGRRTVSAQSSSNS